MIRLAGLLLAVFGLPLGAQAQHVGVPLVSTSMGGVVSATYGYFRFISATSGLGSSLTDGDKGDISVASSGAAWTIDSGAVTYAKIQNVSTNNRLLGRSTAGAGSIEELTLGSGLSLSGGALTLTESDPQVGNVTSGNACIGTGSAVDCGDANAGTKDDLTTRTPSGFWQTSTATTGEGWPETTNSWYHLLASTHSTTGNYYSMQLAGDFFNSNGLFYRATNGSGSTAWNRLWHSGNDGAGSGLDADTLDGLSSAAFIQTATGDTTKVAKTGDTMTGNLHVAPSGVGYLSLIQGSVSNPGYIAFLTSDTTRRGYLGWANGSNLVLATENSWGLMVTTAGSERMRIDTDGNVGIGAAPGTPRLYVYRNDANATIYGYNGSNGAAVRGYSASGASGYFQTAGANYGVYGESAGSYGMFGRTTHASYGGVIGYTADIAYYGILGHANGYSFYGNGPVYSGGAFTSGGSMYATAYYHTSDRALKSNIETYSGGLATIEKLRGVRFDWSKNKTASVGVIAQEVEKVLPSAVSTNLHGHKAVDYDQLIAPMIEAIKELKAANDNLKVAKDKLARENLALRDDVRQIKEALRLR